MPGEADCATAGVHNPSLQTAASRDGLEWGLVKTVPGLSVSPLVAWPRGAPTEFGHLSEGLVSGLRPGEEVARRLEALPPVRLQAERAPDAADRRLTERALHRQRPAAPVGRIVGLRLERVDNHLLHLRIRNAPRRASSRLIDQAIETLLQE